MSKASSYQRRARDFTQRENWDAALAELRQAIASDAANPMLHNQMGDLFLRKEEVQEACLHFEKAIDLYSDLALHANAVALCRKVIRLCPSRVEVRFRLARLRHDQGLQSETTAAFADYVEHVPARSEGDVRHLEERCREIVDQFPLAAPIGKILEKLEAAHAFAAAFEIVQRLAQRAADAGDDDAARRYTTKMRSLRVLVEGRGGDLPGKSAEVARPAAAVPGYGMRDLDPSSAPLASERPQPQTGPRSLQLEDIRGTIARAAFGNDEPEAPQMPEPPAATVEPQIAVQPTTVQPTFEVDVPAADADVPATAMNVEPAAAAASEYELPETSLEDIALLFGRTNYGADAALEPEAGVFEIDVPEGLDASSGEEREVESAAAPDADDVLPPLTLGASSADAFATSEVADAFAIADEAPVSEEVPAAHDTPSAESDTAEPANEGWRETFAAVPEWSLDAPPDAAAPPEVELPDSGTEEHTFGAVPEFTWKAPDVAMPTTLPAPHELSTPVWIPDASSGDLAGPLPQEGGSTHELVEVIDTFRRQMALALGDDAAARYDLGVAYFEMGLYEEALTEFEVARGSAALRERSLEMMATCMAMQGRHAEILDLLAPVVQAQADPTLGLGLRFSMGVACETLGRRSEARAHFEAVAQVDGSYRDVRARLQRY